MQNFPNIPQIQSFNPTGVGQVVGGVIFYGAAVVISILGLSTIYVLIRNGRSRALSFVVSLVYLMFYVTLMTQGIGILTSLK